MDRGRFSSHFLLSVDNMCLSFFSLERVFWKNADVHNFISKWRRPWSDSFWWFTLSISTPTMDRGRFSCHFLLSVDNMCLSFFSLWEFSEKNADVDNFISKWRRHWPDFCWWFTLSISTPTMDRGRFSSDFFLSVDNMCLSFFSLWEFSEKMLTCPILSQNGEGPDPFFWWFLLSISTPTMDRGRFSSHFLLSVDNMCLSFFSLWEFSEKMLTWTISSQNGEGPDPIFVGDLPSPFQRPQWTGVDFPATSFYPWTTCVFPSLVSKSFLKKCWRAQFQLKMAKALTRFFFDDFSSPFQRPQWTGVDFPATSFYPCTTCVFPSLVCESFQKKC